MSKRSAVSSKQSKVSSLPSPQDPEQAALSAWVQAAREARSRLKRQENLSTELILEKYCRIATLSPYQRAACRLLDGLPVGDLEDYARQLTGGFTGCGGGDPPPEALFLAAVRSAKTLTAAACAIRMSQTARLDHMAPGEMPRISIISLKLDLSVVAFQQISGILLQNPELKTLLVGEPRNGSLEILHPSGRTIEIACVAASKAGSSLVARWSAGVIFDEAPRMAGQDEGVSINLDDLRANAVSRVLPGCQILYIGSPWAAEGPVYDMDQQWWGHESPDVLVMKATGPQLNPVWWTPERCESVKTKSPDAYQTDVMGKYLAPESAMLAEAVEGAARPQEPELPPVLDHHYSAAMDPATRSNAWTLVVIEQAADKRRVALARQWLPRPGQPLDAGSVMTAIAGLLRPYRVTRVATDQWAADALLSLGRDRGLYVDRVTYSSDEEVQMWGSILEAMLGGRLELAPVRDLLDDLRKVTRRITGQKVRIVLPQQANGRHCDFAPAVLRAWATPLPKPTAKAVAVGSPEWRALEEAREDEWIARRVGLERRWEARRKYL